jgi:hypothetical protein
MIFDIHPLYHYSNFFHHYVNRLGYQDQADLVFTLTAKEPVGNKKRGTEVYIETLLHFFDSCYAVQFKKD